MAKLYTMVGLPGSGKSTFAKHHPNCVVVSTDEIRAELFGDANEQKEGNKVFAVAFERIANALAENKDVIFDATNVGRKNRKQILKRFEAVHIAVYINTSVEECKRRNAKRERVVPNEVIDRMASRLTIPTEAEGFNHVIIL